MVLSWFCHQASPPNTVGIRQLARLLFHLSMVAALAENLPHRSREHEFSAGRVGIFFENNFLFLPLLSGILSRSFDVQHKIVFSHVGIPTIRFRAERSEEHT